MISFKKIDDVYADLCTEGVAAAWREALDCALEMSGFVYEVSACFAHGCLLLRVLGDEGGEYYFPYPEAVSEDADVCAALDEISRYTVKECIPEIITEVRAEDLPKVVSGTRHVNIDAMDNEANIYTVSVKTECMLTDTIPDVCEGRVYLGELCAAYADKYAELCSDGEVNRYFGYDYREDMPDADGIDLIRAAEREFSLGIAVNFAATTLSNDGSNIFIGDAALYAFDGRGGAHICFRLLPQWQGRGLGSDLFFALILAARQLNLTKIYAEAMSENEASVRLLEKNMTEVASNDGAIKKYIVDL